jgi:predicted permease
LSIFALGFVLTIKKLWPEQTPSSLSFIVVKIAAPCLAITSITARFDRELLVSSLVLLLIAVLHIFLNFLLAKTSSKFLRLNGGKKTIYEVTYTFSNVIFVGLPINQIVFGDEGVSFLFAYYIVILAAFWSLGVGKIAAAAPENPKNIKNKIQIGQIINPGFVGVIIGSIMVYAGLHLPEIADTVLGYLGGLTVPLSLLVIGANLVVFSKGIPHISKDEVVIMLGKFVISPLVMLGLLKLFSVEGLPFAVFMLSSAMPCHMQTSILAQHYNVEAAYASKLVGLSTVLSLVTIPVYVGLIL